MSNPLADELRTASRAGPCALVIFGASGDLTRRKLVPALMGLAADGLLPTGFSVIGFARSDMSSADFRRELADGIEQHGRQGARGASTRDAFAQCQGRFEYLQGTYDDPGSYRRLAARLAEIDRERGTLGNRLFYLATPPNAYPTILEQLSASELSAERGDATARIVIEKPFGHDLESARALNAQVAAAFREHQVFRIDHYLGKETVQNILALRFANSIFEPLWNHKYVDHVQITVAESLGLEGRGGYFESAGILRDMIQNHLLQVLTLVAMEPPVASDGDSIRDEKVKVLRAIRSLTPEKVADRTVRGQYARGFVKGEEVPGYQQEPDVAPDSTTETYAAIRLHVDTWRWAGTPFFLRSGKRLARRVTEVAIHFERPPHLLYGDIDRNRLDQNVLLLRIQPDEGVSLRFGSKVPGPDFQIRGVRMDFSYGTAFGGSTADAYERLLLDAMRGDTTLFARRDEVEEAWRIVDSIVAGWAAGGRAPAPYEAGTWGPAEAEALLGPGRAWRRP
ncbi:MAG: glucose-6-phosphate dehydrogenase [Planctomycetes bacterium]|nr:glucose-6-phosphate dehydrogenase [Planctomycetota bacterium]